MLYWVGPLRNDSKMPWAPSCQPQRQRQRLQGLREKSEVFRCTAPTANARNSAAKRQPPQLRCSRCGNWAPATCGAGGAPTTNAPAKSSFRAAPGGEPQQPQQHLRRSCGLRQPRRGPPFNGGGAAWQGALILKPVSQRAAALGSPLQNFLQSAHRLCEPRVAEARASAEKLPGFRPWFTRFSGIRIFFHWFACT